MNNQIEMYNDVELTSEVMSASSHRLIQLLFENVLQRMKLAKLTMINNNHNEKLKHLSKACSIFEYLRLCLKAEDKKSQELTELLSLIYIRSEKNLFYAGLKNDVSYIDETILMISNVKEGWDGIKDKVGAEHV